MKNLFLEDFLYFVNLRTKKIISCLWLAIMFVAMIYVFWGRKFYSAYKKYCLWKNNRIILEQKIKKLKFSICQKKYFIRKLMTDRTFREYVAHEQNGFLSSNEYVIYFKQNEELHTNIDVSH